MTSADHYRKTFVARPRPLRNPVKGTRATVSQAKRSRHSRRKAALKRAAPSVAETRPALAHKFRQLAIRSSAIATYSGPARSPHSYGPTSAPPLRPGDSRRSRRPKRSSAYQLHHTLHPCRRTRNARAKVERLRGLPVRRYISSALVGARPSAERSASAQTP